VGPLGGITLLPSLIGARRNPNGERLEQVLPADLYARWLPLKARYLGDNGSVEEWRPIFAAQELYKAAERIDVGGKIQDLRRVFQLAEPLPGGVNIPPVDEFFSFYMIHAAAPIPMMHRVKVKYAVP
jgi:hypothetical protein